MEPNIKAHLIADTAVQAIAGNRIHAQVIPQMRSNDAQRYPCAVFTLVGTSEQSGQCGTIAAVQGTFQIDSYDPDRDRALALADAIRRRMVDYVGLMGDVHVSSVKRTTQFDVGPEPEPGLYRRSQTFTIWYAEN